MIIADTSVWIDYVKGIDAPHTDMLDNELIRNRVVTGDIIITEFLQGFKNDREYLMAKKYLLCFAGIPMSVFRKLWKYWQTNNCQKTCLWELNR